MGVDMVEQVVDMILQQETLDHEVIKVDRPVMHLLDLLELVERVISLLVPVVALVVIVLMVAAAVEDTTAAVAAVVVLTPIVIQVIVDQVMVVVEVVMSIPVGPLS